MLDFENLKLWKKTDEWVYTIYKFQIIHSALFCLNLKFNTIGNRD